TRTLDPGTSAKFSDELTRGRAGGSAGGTGAGSGAAAATFSVGTADSTTSGFCVFAETAASFLLQAGTSARTTPIVVIRNILMRNLLMARKSVQLRDHNGGEKGD